MRRLLPVLPALLLVLLGASACGDDDGGASDDTSGSSGGAATSDSSFADLPDAGASGDDGPPPCDYVEGGPASRDVELPPEQPLFSGDVDAVISTDQGDVPITLTAGSAPCTVNSFVSLADQGYFDDTTCHRLTGGGGLSVLQCGDPTATGTGGPGYSFPDELTNKEQYPAGTLAMANAGPDTNGSQFFIVYADSALPPSYTVFGTVSPAGLKVVQGIAAAGSDNSNGPGDGKPNTPVTIESVKPAA